MVIDGVVSALTFVVMITVIALLIILVFVAVVDMAGAVFRKLLQSLTRKQGQFNLACSNAQKDDAEERAAPVNLLVSMLFMGIQ